MSRSPFPPQRPSPFTERPVAPGHREIEPRRAITPPIRYRDLRKLYPYQREGVSWLHAHQHGLLAYEQRLGKTGVSLLALPYDARCIVICPATIKLAWRDAVQGIMGEEAEREGGKWATVGWRKDLTARIVNAGGDLVPSKGEVVITNYEALPFAASKSALLASNLRDVHLIVDEAHLVKNPEADRTEKVAALARQVGHVWPLTGTPMPGTPLDLWGLLETCLLAKPSFGTFSHFLEIFGGRRTRKKFGPAFEFTGTHYEDAKEALAKVMLRKRRVDVAPQMPAKVYTDIPVEITANAIIENAEREWQLRGATTLPPFDLLSAALAELARLKIPAMLEVVESHEAANLPLLVFSKHLDPIRALQNRPGWATITGEDGNMQRRHSIVEQFQAGLLKGIGIGIQAGGTGLALHAAADELFVSLEWTPALNEQAEDRAVSMSQLKKTLHVNLLVADHPLDRRLFEILRAKETLIAGIIG